VTASMHILKQVGIAIKAATSSSINGRSRIGAEAITVRGQRVSGHAAHPKG
jgi:hypothetical protein